MNRGKGTGSGKKKKKTKTASLWKKGKKLDSALSFLSLSLSQSFCSFTSALQPEKRTHDARRHRAAARV
jgi:hypothetical protein